jgi:hypothetical protein
MNATYLGLQPLLFCFMTCRRRRCWLPDPTSLRNRDQGGAWVRFIVIKVDDQGVVVCSMVRLLVCTMGNPSILRALEDKSARERQTPTAWQWEKRDGCTDRLSCSCGLVPPSECSCSIVPTSDCRCSLVSPSDCKARRQRYQRPSQEGKQRNILPWLAE